MSEQGNGEGSGTVDLEGLRTGILSDIKSYLGRRAPADDGEPEEGQKVPYHRFKAYGDENKRLRGELEALSGRVGELATAFDETLSGKLAEVQAQAAQQVAEIGTRHQRELQLHDMGLTDPDGRDALRTAYSRLPAEGRAETVVDYFTGLLGQRQQHHEGVEGIEAPAIPRTLTGYLPELAPVEVEAPAPRRRGPPSESGTRPRGPTDIRSVPMNEGKDAFLAGLGKMEQ